MTRAACWLLWVAVLAVAVLLLGWWITGAEPDPGQNARRVDRSGEVATAGGDGATDGDAHAAMPLPMLSSTERTSISKHILVRARIEDPRMSVLLARPDGATLGYEFASADGSVEFAVPAPQDRVLLRASRFGAPVNEAEFARDATEGSVDWDLGDVRFHEIAVTIAVDWEPEIVEVMSTSTQRSVEVGVRDDRGRLLEEMVLDLREFCTGHSPATRNLTVVVDSPTRALTVTWWIRKWSDQPIAAHRLSGELGHARTSRLQLLPDSVVRGRVVDAGGRALSDEAVCYSSDRQPSSMEMDTDGYGRFCFLVGAGDRGCLFLSADQPRVLFFDGATPLPRTGRSDVLVTAGAPVDVVDRRDYLRFRLLDATGQPVAKYEVRSVATSGTAEAGSPREARVTRIPAEELRQHGWLSFAVGDTGQRRVFLVPQAWLSAVDTVRDIDESAFLPLGDIEVSRAAGDGSPSIVLELEGTGPLSGLTYRFHEWPSVTWVVGGVAVGLYRYRVSCRDSLLEGTVEVNATTRSVLIAPR